MSDLQPVRIGILHSLSGSLALSEAPLYDAALMAIAEINAAGGVLGRLIEPMIRDGASNPWQFAQAATELIEQEQVVSLFGCWTSACRKAIIPVLERHNALLWYPVQYEGLEQSPQVFYMGACPNQQVEPALGWLLRRYGKRLYLLGSDYVFPRTANKVIAASLTRFGGTVLAEEYVPLGATEFTATLERIAVAQPDVLFSTLNGDSNLAFYRAYGESAVKSMAIPVMATSVAEPELQEITTDAAGTYASWSYFQSLDTPENRRFVAEFQARYGHDRVTSASVVRAYSQVYLWKQAVEAAQSFAVDQVRSAAYGQQFHGPDGVVEIEPNHHLRQFCRVGRVLPTGQFEILYRSDVPITPKPWLGVEDADFPNAPLVIDLLSQVSKGFQANWELGQQSIQLEQTIAQLQRETVERQQAEAELQALFQAMPELVVVYDRQGTLRRIMSDGPDWIDGSSPNRVGTTVRDHFPADQVAAVLACIQQALDQNKTQHHLYSLTINGDPCWFAANISPLSVDTVIWVARNVTDRIQAEQARQKSEAMTLSLIHAIPDLMARVNAAGVYLDIKPFKDMDTVFNTEQVLGKSMAEVMPADIVEQRMSAIQQALATGEVQFQEYRVQTAAGDIRYQEGRFVAVTEDEVVIIIRDITDRKRVEEELRSANAEMQALFAAMDQLIFVFDREGRHLKIVASNPRLQFHPSQDRLGKTLHEVFSPELADQFLGYIWQVLDTQETLVVDYRMTLDEGELWSNASISPIDDQSVIWVTRDITDRKQTEEALRLAEENYRSIVENAVDGIFQTLPDGHYRNVNLALARIYGYESPEDLMTSVTNVQQQLYVNGADRDRFIAQMAAQGIVTEFEAQVYRQDGSIIWISETARAVRDDGGTLLYYEGTTSDITRRHLAEEALRAREKKIRRQNQCLLDLAKNKALNQGDLLSALEAITKATAELLIVDRVSVWLYDPTKTQLQCIKLYELSDDRYSEGLQITMRSYPLYLETMQTLGVIIANDALQDPRLQELQASYLQPLGIRALMDLPIRVNGELSGAICLEHRGTLRQWTPEEESFVRSIADLVMLGIEARERKRAEEALAKANAEILALNERLKSENLRMSAELDITRRLQRMILPKEAELQAISMLDIAGFMEPASEVGGDYYDVLNHNGTVKIGIGDVTGHGLESGMLMLMVQTAVRTLLISGETNPETFLNVLNQIVYDNVQRMDCDRSLSLSLVDYADGTLNLSGQHEELIIIRHGGEIERVDTIDLGFPIGLVPDISTFVGKVQILLQPGDVVLLYTDGITEAENQVGELYGLDRLCQVAKQSYHLTAREIQQAIVADVRQHIGTHHVYDDITLLVFKQK